jgi:hypothetical protein
LDLLLQADNFFVCVDMNTVSWQHVDLFVKLRLESRKLEIKP